MCCSDDEDALRWVVLVRLFYGSGFGNTWEYAFTIHSMNVRRLVRTTSVILLLGVGSFVCYKLYCQLRQRFRRRKKSKRETPSLHRSHIVENWISGIEHKGIQGCCVDSDNESDISDVSLPATSQASFGDIPKPVTEHEEAEKQRDGSSSCGGGSFLSDDEFVDMGVGSSNPYEPVRFDSHSGDVRFQGFSPPKTSTPLNIASKNQNNGGGSLRLRSRKGKLDDSQPARLSKQSQKETSGVKTGSGFGDFEASVKNNNNNDGDRAPLSDDSVSQDPESLLDSLSFEGGGEASTPWAANDTVSLLANFSIGSLCERNRRTEELISSRADSQGEETDDFSLGGGMVSDSALLRLRNSHSRQLSADSEASDLSIFERAQAPLEVPCEAFETIDKLETVLHDTKQELLDLDADLVSLRVFRKLPANYDIVLEDVNKKNIDGLVHRSSIRESRDANADSGSDFGNSLESDSERLAKESSGPSLEWDSLPLSRQFSEQQHESDSTDFGGFSEFSESEDGGEPRSVLGVVRRHSSGNIHNVGMGTLREQIQRILYEESESWKRHLVRSQTLPVDQSLPESDRPLVPRTREPILVNKIAAVPEENTPSPSSASEFASSFAASSDRDTSMDTNGNDLRDVLKDDTVSEFESSESPTCIEDKVMLADYILGLRRQRRHHSGDGMGKSLAAVLSGLEVRSLRRTKGDGYAAIRAAGFQILASGGSILAAHRGANGIYQRFHDLVASPGAKPWLEGWAFHCSLRGVHTLQGFWECLSLLQDLEDQLRLTATPEALLAKKLNADPLTDAKFVEAIKIIMLKSALELFAKQKDSDAPCPLFATVLFSQVTATSPEEYLVHHLSQLGRDRAVPEPELYLLGYALETTLTVVRPSRLGSEDIVNRYPEWQVGSWPEAVLLEHEGHFWACAT